MPSLLDNLRGKLSPDHPPARAGWHGDEMARNDNPVTVPAAVLVPIVRRPEPAILLTTRSDGLRHHSGQVAFPGGRIDPDDAGPVAAALREAQEEVGLDPGEVDIFGLASPYQTGTGYLVQPVVGTLPPDLPLAPNPGEVANIFEVPLAYIFDPRNHQMREGTYRGHRRRYHVIEWQGHHIWGATAGMLVRLTELIG